MGINVIGSYFLQRLPVAAVCLVAVTSFGAAALVAWLIYQSLQSGRLPEAFSVAYALVMILLGFGCFCSGAAFWTAMQRRRRRQYQSYLSSCLRSPA